MLAASVWFDLAALAATGGDDAIIAFLDRKPVPLEGFRESDAIWVFRLCCCGIGGRGHRFLGCNMCGVDSSDHGGNSRAQIALGNVATAENIGNTAAVVRHLMERVPSVSAGEMVVSDLGG